MKYITETNEITEHQDCIDGYKWKRLVGEILEHLRDDRKYQGQKVINIELLEKFIYDNMRDYNITRDE